MAETTTLIEGEEEVQYVFVSLPNEMDPVAFGPGSTVTIEGLATEHPMLRSAISQPSSSAQPATAAAGASGGKSSNASVLQGQYVDNMGSILFVKEQPTASHNAKPTYAYVGHTDKQLDFKKP